MSQHIQAALDAPERERTPEDRAAAREPYRTPHLTFYGRFAATTLAASVSCEDDLTQPGCEGGGV